MPPVKKLLSGTFSDYILFGTSVLVGLLLAPLMINGLGRAVYGLWATIGSIMNYIGLLDAGLSNAVPRFVAYYRAREGDRGASVVVASSFVMYTVIAGCVVLVALFVSGHLDLLVALEGIPQRVGAIALVLAAMAMAVRLALNPFQGAIFGHERLHVVNAVQTGFFLLQGALTALALVAGRDLLAVASANLVATVVAGGVIVLYVRKSLPGCFLKLSSFRLGMAKELLKYSSFVFLTAISMQIILSMDNLAIGHMLGVSAVASYALAFQLVLISRQALTRLGRVLVPLYSRHDALEERQLSARIFLEVSSISAALGTILTVFLALFGGDLIRLWVGAQNFVGWTTLWLLCPFVLIQSIVEPGQLALLSIRRHRLVALLRGVEALLKAVLTLLLVRRWGVAGAAFSTLFAAVSITSWSLPLVTLREFQIPVATYLRRAVVPQVALGLFLLLAGRLLVRWWRPDNLLQVVFVAALMALLYGLLYWFLFLNQGQRAFYLRLAGGLFHEEH